MAAMKQPPAPEQEPTNLWLQLTALPRPTKVFDLPVTLPGTDEPVGQVRMWPLTQEEQMLCNAEADNYTKKLMADPQKSGDVNLGYHHNFSNESAIRIVWRAMRDYDDPQRPVAPAPGELRRVLTTDQLGVLFNHYLSTQMELGPIRTFMTDAEQEAMILRIVQSASADPFDSLSWEQQRTLVLGLASRLVSSWTAIRSAGLPLDVSALALSEVDSLVAKREASQESADTDEPLTSPA